MQIGMLYVGIPCGLSEDHIEHKLQGELLFIVLSIVNERQHVKHDNNKADSVTVGN